MEKANKTKTLTQTKLNKIIGKHLDYLAGKEGGKHANFDNCVLQNLKLTGINLTGVSFKYVVMLNCDLTQSIFDECDMSNSVLNSSILSGASFVNSNLHNSYLRETEMINTNFKNANVSFCDFSLSNCSGIFDYADLNDSVFFKSILRLCSFKSAYMLHCDLRLSDLTGANFSNTILTHSTFKGSNLTQCRFYLTILDFCDLTGANLKGCNLVNSSKQETKLPLQCKWEFGIKGDEIFVGCQSKTALEWEEWLESEKIFLTLRDDEEFKNIRACIIAAIAYWDALNE
jgi:uncharacterized protein YjbI with pentapeptide repeats